MSRRAKIVATLGPATDGYENLRSLIEAGLDVARFNLSHGTYEDHERNYVNVRKAAKDTGRNVAVLCDLQGPKIRLGVFADGPIVVKTGDIFTITAEDVPGNQDICSTTYKGLPDDCQAGDRLLLDDGKVAVRVVSVDGPRVKTEVEIGGPLSDHKGINLPGVAVSVPALTEKDERDLRWALQHNADIIALSFVRKGSDIDRVHEIMDEEGVHLPVIAKIEKPQAVTNLRDIVAAFDGIMVARGDLGVEVPLEEVPIVQKQAIELARRQAKPVIVATQMLESMTTNPRPTRAEASDVANAILDGADAVMLSGETSVGAWPTRVVETMAAIVASTEEHGLDRIAPLGTLPHTQGGAITRAASEISDLLGAKYVCAFSESGDTVRRMARIRSKTPLKAFTPSEKTRSQLALSWGTETYLVPKVNTTDEMVGEIDQVLVREKQAEDGDMLVVVSGSPVGVPGTTNTLRVHRVGDPVDSDGTPRN